MPEAMRREILLNAYLVAYLFNPPLYTPYCKPCGNALCRKILKKNVSLKIETKKETPKQQIKKETPEPTTKKTETPKAKVVKKAPVKKQIKATPKKKAAKKPQKTVSKKPVKKKPTKKLIPVPKKETTKKNIKNIHVFHLRQICKDGSISYQDDVSKNNYRGMCSGHKGIRKKLGRQE